MNTLENRSEQLVLIEEIEEAIAVNCVRSMSVSNNGYNIRSYLVTNAILIIVVYNLREIKRVKLDK